MRSCQICRKEFQPKFMNQKTCIECLKIKKDKINGGNNVQDKKGK